MSSQPSSKYFLEVDQDKCISASSCVALAPQTFQLNDQHKAQVISQDSDDDETKLMAAQTCPAGAIRVIDAKNKTQIWPKSS